MVTWKEGQHSDIEIAQVRSAAPHVGSGRLHPRRVHALRDHTDEKDRCVFPLSLTRVRHASVLQGAVKKPIVGQGTGQFQFCARKALVYDISGAR